MREILHRHRRRLIDLVRDPCAICAVEAISVAIPDGWPRLSAEADRDARPMAVLRLDYKGSATNAASGHTISLRSKDWLLKRGSIRRQQSGPP